MCIYLFIALVPPMSNWRFLPPIQVVIARTTFPPTFYLLFGIYSKTTTL